MVFPFSLSVIADDASKVSHKLQGYHIPRGHAVGAVPDKRFTPPDYSQSAQDEPSIELHLKPGIVADGVTPATLYQTRPWSPPPGRGLLPRD